jgi:hypothetical protein
MNGRSSLSAVEEASLRLAWMLAGDREKAPSGQCPLTADPSGAGAHSRDEKTREGTNRRETGLLGIVIRKRRDEVADEPAERSDYDP